MKFTKTSILAALALTAGAVAMASTGCELIASVDPSLVEGAGGTGGTTTSSSSSSSSGIGGSGGASSSSSSSTSSSGGGTGGGGGGGCTTAAMCPGPMPANECKIATCIMGVCGEDNVAKDTPLAIQNPADCKQDVCDGTGGKTTKNDDTDLPVDATLCTRDVCTAGVPTNPPDVAAETACTDNNGTVCNGTGTCVECVSNPDCKDVAKPVCKTNQCVNALCSDGIINGTETDVDCGGSCTPCPDTKKCLIAADCVNKVCDAIAKTCTAATCNDTVKNGAETDVDCGGGTCPKCALTKACVANGDCVGANCIAKVCSPSCSDGTKNQTETDVDCGGLCASQAPPLKCADNKGCSVAGDCTGNACTAANKCCTPEAATVTCAGKCGTGVPNNCGSPVDCTVPANGGTTCMGVQTCNAASHTCGCVDEAATVTCSGKCGAGVPNNCGTMVDCTIPANGGTTCTDQGAASCGTTGACVAHACAQYAAGTTCRGSAGNCDVNETCPGGGAACPVDLFLSGGTVCRPAVAGGCDIEEQCSGSSAACPVDVVVAGGTECRAAAGACDVAENCTGSAAACPGNAFAASSVECRASAGPCDVAENCTGSTATCPTNAFAASGVCRASVGSCDVAETCDGTAATCSADVIVALGAMSATCTGTNACDGIAGLNADCKLANGETCAVNGVCASGNCASSVCAP